MEKDIFWILLSKKICGEADANEMAALEEIIRQDYELGAIAERMQQIWSSTPSALTPSKSAKDAFEKISDLINLQPNSEKSITIRRNSRRKTYFSIAATITIFLAFTTIYYSYQHSSLKAFPQKEESSSSEIVMSPGSRTKLQLPDGTSVWVNACSKIKYAGGLKDKKREVYLEGEAYFEVKRDTTRPFIVHTNGIDIKVLGTGFNVKAYPTEPTIEATLIHGSIEVINQNQPTATHVLLKPHEKLVYNKAELTPLSSKENSSTTAKDFVINIAPISSVKPISDIKETSWIFDKLIFEEESLEDLAIRMERWYGVKIIINDSKLKNYKISGSFVNETLDEALKELQMLINFSFEQKDKEIIIK